MRESCILVCAIKMVEKKIMNLVLYTFEEDEGNFHWVRSTKQYEDSS